MDSLILGRDKNYVKVLEQWTGKRWKIQYRGSRDGFTSQNFHSLCDIKGESLFIAEDINGYIFGGYTSFAWRSTQNYVVDQNAFIFTLKNPNNIPPTKYPCTGTVNAVYDHSSYMPTFGGGHDICTNGSCNANSNSFNFPVSYSDTTGKGSATFTGNSNWRAKEIEVFIVDK